MKRPKAFLSYSHNDRDVATRLAESLRASGIDVWFDRWEILPGDSLIQKVFEEGLSGADAFIVLISPNSAESRWVRQELDTAMIKRIEGVTRIIPVVIGDVVVPQALRALRWIKAHENFDETIRELQAAIFRVHERPALGQPPKFVRDSMVSVGGLSPLATSVGLFLASTGKPDVGNEESFSAADVAEKLGLEPEETDDAIDELERLGLVKVRNYLGTSPFSHGEIQPTYALFLHFKDAGLDYNPEEDIKTVASAVVAHKEIDGPRLQEITELSPLRINRAIAYLKDYGVVQILQFMGTAPFDFGIASSTGATRRFVAENSK